MLAWSNQVLLILTRNALAPVFVANSVSRGSAAVPSPRAEQVAKMKHLQSLQSMTICLHQSYLHLPLGTDLSCQVQVQLLEQLLLEGRYRTLLRHPSTGAVVIPGPSIGTPRRRRLQNTQQPPHRPKGRYDLRQKAVHRRRMG